MAEWLLFARVTVNCVRGCERERLSLPGWLSTLAAFSCRHLRCLLQVWVRPVTLTIRKRQDLCDAAQFSLASASLRPFYVYSAAGDIGRQVLTVSANSEETHRFLQRLPDKKAITE